MEETLLTTHLKHDAYVALINQSLRFNFFNKRNVRMCLHHKLSRPSLTLYILFVPKCFTSVRLLICILIIKNKIICVKTR